MSRPRVLIDARMVAGAPHGIARYVSAMARGLAELGREGRLAFEPVFLVVADRAAPDFEGFETQRARARFLAPRELAELPWLLRRSRADLYHSPSFASLLPLSCPCPWLVTVHDLNHLAYGSMAQKVYYAGLLKPFCKGARRVLSVSRFSAAELGAWMARPASEIEVVYNSLSDGFLRDLAPAELREMLSRHGLRADGYFISLGNRKPHKNISLLLSAYAAYRREAKEALPLVLNLTQAQAGELGSTEGVLALPELEDRNLPGLYAGAAAAFFPSLYEGFGLGPVEAAAVGARVVVSRIPPHEEGLAGAAHTDVSWADPLGIGHWQALLKVASRGGLPAPSSAFRAALRERFSTRRMGRDMDRIYRDVLGLS